jgi:hypothetical protein
MTMNVQKLVDWFESMYMALALAWTVGIAVALLQPQVTSERHGVVEVYSLVAVDGAQSAI